MLRRGIAYGDGVTKEEQQTNTTLQDRGLAFACYTSSLVDGFRIVQIQIAGTASTTTIPPIPR